MGKMPKYTGDKTLESLVGFLREWIRSGHVKVGAVLPSVRSAAEELPFDRNTIQRAYATLQAEGYLESSAGKGTRIVATRPEALRFDWTRYWWPADIPDQPHLFGDLLWTPGIGNVNEQAKTIEDIDEQPIAILLGEAGMGKSFELKRLGESRSTESQADRVYFDLGRLSDAGELRRVIEQHPAYKRALSESIPPPIICLDSLDEALARAPHLLDSICEIIGKIPSDRRRVRLACRANAWSQQHTVITAKALGTGELSTFRLLPLTQADVEAAAEARGIDSQSFLEVVNGNGLRPLAARPITLNFLLERHSNGDLSASSLHDILLEGITRLLSEPDAARETSGTAGKLGAQDRLAIVERIAILHLLCCCESAHNGRRVRSSGICGPRELNALPRGSTFTRDTTPEDLDEVLNTALFEPTGDGCFRFAHRMYAEFLAAQCMIEMGLSDSQVERILWGQRGSQRGLPVGMRELAAWLAMNHGSLRKLIARTEPHVLLLADVASLCAEERAELVNEILDRVDAQELSWDTQRDVQALAARLKHDDLASQLEAAIRSPNRSDDARDIAIDIAAACELRELAEVLVQTTVDVQESMSLRVAASYALRRLQRTQLNTELPGLKHLRMIVANGALIDSDQHLLGNALHLLWPNYLSAEELFFALQPQNNPSMHGAYAAFLSSENLLQTLDVDDVLVALKWVELRPLRHPHLGHDELDELAETILHRAWELLDDPRVLDAAVGPMIRRMREHIPIFSRPRKWNDPSREDTCHEELRAHPERRRDLAAAVITRMAGSSTDAAERRSQVLAFMPRMSGLLIAPDLEWVIHRAITAAEGEQDLWIEAANRLLLWYPESTWTDSQRDVIVKTAMGRNRPANLFEWLMPIEIKSQEAERLRASVRRSQEFGRPRKKRRPKHAFRAVLESWVEGSESGQPNCWYEIHRLLLVEASLDCELTDDVRSLNTVLKSKPWQSADRKLQQRIVGTAEKFLDTRSPVKAILLHDANAWGEYWSTFEALRLVLREHHEWLKRRDASWWNAWVPLIAMWRDDSDAATELDSALAELALEHAEAQCIASIATLLRSRPEWDRSESSLPRFVEHRNGRLAGLVAEFLRLGQPAGPNQVASVLKFLLEVDVDLAQSVVAERIKARTSDHRWELLSSTLAATAIRGDAIAMWPVVWPAMSDDPNWGKAVMSSVAYGSRHDGSELLTRLSVTQAAELLVWMWKKMPMGQIPDRRSRGAFTPTQDEEVSRLRELLMGLVVKSNSEDCERALVELCDWNPESRWFRNCLIRHREQAVKWSHMEPIVLAQMLIDATKRNVTTNEDLASVVLESIRRFEDIHQRQDNPLRSNLWNTPKEGPATFKGEEHLSDNLRRHIANELVGSGLVVNREVQIVRPKRHPSESQGKDLDILIESPARTGDGSLRIVIEVKVDKNDSVLTSCGEQLEQRYMDSVYRPYGIYCVAWTGEMQAKWPELSDLRKAIESFRPGGDRLCQSAQVVVIDCSLAGAGAK